MRGFHVAKDFPRRIVARRAGDAAARMRARAAHVEAGDRRAVIGMAEHRAGRKNLVERQRAMKDVAAEKAEGAFEIERRKHLPPEHRGLEVRRIGIDRLDHQVGDRLRVIVP